MSETTLQAGYVLHYTPWRDTSFIVDLFTLEHGRLGLMAKGARGAKPRTRALYQPFRPLLVSWYGEGELRTLTGIEESGAALALEGTALACGYYVNELVLRLLGKDQPQPELFAHYALALATLAAGDGSPEGTLRTFELQLLETTGVLPDLARCTPRGEPVEAERRYRFHPANALAVPLASDVDAVSYGIPKRRGGEVVEEHDVHPDGITPDEGIEIAGSTLIDMAALDFERSRTREEAKSLMRRLIAAQLGGRPLRSRSMFEALVPPPAVAPEAVSDARSGDGSDDGSSDRADDGSSGRADDGSSGRADDESRGRADDRAP